MTDIFLIAGLGNPGPGYAHNRHNIGFLAADLLAREYNANPWSKKFSGEICEARISGARAFLLKPQTYMNLSGESVAACARFYKIPVEQIIVLHDELDIATAKLKVKQGGGAGGHNGIKSIDAHMGENYVRVRLGIAHPGDKTQVSDYVLSDFGKSEWAEQERMLEALVKNFPLLISGNTAGFMNKIALEMSPPSLPGSLPPLRGKVRKGGSPTTELARTLRATMTDAEKKLWYHLRRENLAAYKFRRQHPLGPYIADFACLEKKLIIEVDGSQHTENAAQDAARTAYFAQTGHKVLRFWNNEVLENINGVLETILMELGPVPHPPS